MAKLCQLQKGACTSLFVFLFAVIFALIEIEIEGTEGWAKNLPTAKNVVGHLTLYHVYMVALATLIVCGFMYFKHTRSSCAAVACGAPKPNTNTPRKQQTAFQKVWPTLRIVLQTVFHLIAYFLIQDFLWFVFNPGFTLARYNQASIPWHKHWWGGTPAFNFVGVGVLGLILTLSMFDGELVLSSAFYLGFLLLACASAPLYHLFYRWLH